MFAKDILDMNLGKDVIIQNACDKRDEAVEEKNAAEVELAENRIELMQASENKIKGADLNRYTFSFYVQQCKGILV